ncbi:NAD(P)/FAD-dependent oxidoreductase [candidate division KSB1 bacterium]|nr:NAD(P)/FAD-dependent oxidoreductase [candidate division KSB1 bacterium]
MTSDYQYAIIGAGVVGLAVAAELAPRGSLVVLEQAWKYGQSTSSHNSEVVHAGLYYPPGSLKARLCIEGNRLIRDLSAAHAIGYRRIGKLVVATTEREAELLRDLRANAEACGVSDLTWLEPPEVAELEPELGATTVGGLFSPSTGIVDSHGLMSYFLHTAQQAGADVVYHSEIVGIERTAGTYRLTVRIGQGGTDTLTAVRVVNSAGLHADRVAELAGLSVDALGLRQHWTKGYYFALTGAFKPQLQHLVYPIPDKAHGSLGVHAVLDLSGGLRFGPTAELMDKAIEDYGFVAADPISAAQAIDRYLPGISDGDLAPVMSGIRPKLTLPGQPQRDFYVAEESAHGLPGFVNLIGIDSPGLTASPAIARRVGELLKR